MKKQETIQIMTLLASNYRNINEMLSDPDKSKMMIATWHSCLEDLEYQVCLLAVKRCIITSQYPPTIHELRKAVVELTTPVENKKTAIDYWNEAYKMICNGSYMTKEEFEKHSPIVKRFFSDVAQVKELAKTNIETINTVTKGQFLKQIETLEYREKQDNMLPPKMKDAINQLGENMFLKQIGDSK